MKSTYKLLLAVLVFAFAPFSQTLHAQEVKDGLTWYSDINKAYEVSTKTHKPIFAFFTGSDWCIWCHRMEQNVMAKNTFKDWAKKNVVLLELDFPRNKKLPDNIAQQNNSLQQFFKVQGFPTVWLFNMEKMKDSDKFNITPMGQAGYPQSEPGKEDVAFIASVDQILKKK